MSGLPLVTVTSSRRNEIRKGAAFGRFPFHFVGILARTIPTKTSNFFLDAPYNRDKVLAGGKDNEERDRLGKRLLSVRVCWMPDARNRIGAREPHGGLGFVPLRRAAFAGISNVGITTPLIPAKRKSLGEA